LAEPAGLSVPQVEGVFRDQHGYATPKVDVRAVVFDGGRILFARERAEGLWSIPGGWADVDESPSEAAVRETFEETGYRVRARKLLAVYDRALHGHVPPFAFHVYKLFFSCEIVGGEPATSHEVDAVGFFGPDDVPPLSVTRVTRSQIERFFELHADPPSPTDFD
jgi:ADP-ribose pyrophosphatase YjhB (NUDIX family)